MKVHFTASLKGNKENYRKIIDALEALGYEMVTNHILKRKLEEVEKETPEEAEIYARKMQQWIKKADILVAEATAPDVSVGYEVGIAINLGKPIVLLHEVGSEPHALKGANLDRLEVCCYSPDDFKNDLKTALEYAKDQMDVRFNFFVSPKIVRFLDWISKKKKMPRAVYLRRLIEQDMAKNKEFVKEE